MIMHFDVHRFESVTSTNDVAARMAREGAPEGTVIVAREQTAGRGRYGRTWTSPPGDGLYLSIVLRPDLPPEHLWQLGFVVSVAAAEAVARVSSLLARLKWPNDVLLNGRKVAGILVEAVVRRSAFSVQRSDLGVRRSAFGVQRSVSAHGPVVVGIGVNANAERFPAEIAEKATSIALETGRPVPPEEIESALLSCLDGWYGDYIHDGFEPVMRAWRELDCTVGRDVEVRTPDGTVAGTAVGIDPSGDLVIECGDGTTSRITAGDVILRAGEQPVESPE